MASGGEVTQRAGIENLSIPCGWICGIPIRLHFFLPLTLVLAALGPALAGHGLLAVLLAVIVAGPLLFLTVLIHELGHVMAAKRCGCTADHILLWPLGGLAFIGGGTVGPKEQIGISIAGPATHLPMLGIWAALMVVTNGGVTLSTEGMWIDDNFPALVCIAMLNNNLTMLLFNLLVPCFPLDCSRIVASTLLMRGFDPGAAAKVIVISSIPVLVALVGLSVWSYMHHHAAASLNVLLAAWLAGQTWKLHQARMQGTLASDPLFAAAMSGVSATSAPAQPSSAGSGGGGGGSFKPFQGGSQTLGKSASAPADGQVCIGAVLALMIALTVSQVGVSP